MGKHKHSSGGGQGQRKKPRSSASAEGGNCGGPQNAEALKRQLRTKHPARDAAADAANKKRGKDPVPPTARSPAAEELFDGQGWTILKKEVSLDRCRRWLSAVKQADYSGKEREVFGV